MAPYLQTATPLTPARKPDWSGKVCVAITGSSMEEMLARVASLPRTLPLVELRLDALDSPFAALSALRTFLGLHPERTVLATCRPRRSGGHLSGSAQDELAVLLEAAAAGCSLVDLSLESAEELGPASLTQLRAAGATVLVSFHDFENMATTTAALDRLRRVAPDVIKLVPTAERLDDSLDLLHTLRSHRLENASLPLVAIAMGEPGILTRILGPHAGSAFTFAAADETAATAPGQLDAATLLERFRIRGMSAATRFYGVAGDPIRSSLSPLMFNAVFANQGTDAVYVPLLTRNPSALFRAARELPLDGFSVTMPLKQTVLPFLQHVEPLARRIGAVNTVYRTKAGEFHGDNTDVAGILVPLERHIPLKGARVLVLGAGGAARAAVFACGDRGATVVVANRTAEKARELALEADAGFVPIEELARQNFDVMINATPAGMRGNATVSPVSEEQMRARLVFDLVYNPAETELLRMAAARGVDVIPGLEMFLQQGARQFEIWTGSAPPLELMRRTVSAALARRGDS